MTDTTAPMQINLMRYGLIYGGATFVLALLPQMLGLNAAYGITVALPPLIGSIVEGQAYAKAQGARVRGEPAWRGALIMAVLGAAIYIVVAGVLLMAVSRQQAVALPILQMLGGFVVLFGIQFLLNRLGLRLAPER
ncbi:MAG TPA: hypothetical protein DEO85_09220 [Maritimibacter sp.]|nr:hypothetical protein [Maritimibacter sp.]